MSAVKNVALMGTSVVLRVAFGMLTFVVMARLLGPNSFGNVMFWISVSTLLALAPNFGFTPFLLKEIGARAEVAHRLIGEVLTARLILGTVVVLVALAAMPWIDSADRIVFGMLLLALIVECVTDLLNVGFRATNLFATETRLAVVSSFVQCAIVVSAMLWSPTPMSAAAAFLASRVLVLWLTWNSQKGFLSYLRPSSILDALARIRRTTSYALDFGLQSLLGQVDSIVLNGTFGASVVGVYQAGMRLYMGGAQSATVLASVFLPRASAIENAAAYAKEVSVVQSAFLTVGALFGLFLAVFSDSIVNLLFGRQFDSLVSMLPWFGLLFFVRFFAASWGIVLTSRGLQSFRAWANLIHWVVILLLATFLVTRYGAIGWLMALLCGNVLLAAAYLIKGMQLVKASFASNLLASAGVLAFVPFVQLPALGQPY